MGPGPRASRRTRASYRRLDPVQQHAETDGERLPGLALQVRHRVVGGRRLGCALALRPADGGAGGEGYGVDRTARPASTEVRLPSSMTKRPSIRTCGMPTGNVRGSSNVEPAATVSGSKRTRSAR